MSDHLKTALIEQLASGRGPFDEGEFDLAVEVLATEELLRRARAELAEQRRLREGHNVIIDHWFKRATWAENQLSRLGHPHREEGSEGPPP